MNTEQLEKITEENRWLDIANEIMAGSLLLNSEEFNTYWVVAGHRVREQISNDRKLINLLRILLPPYNGVTLHLYRGENQIRFNAGSIGLAWTTEIRVAQMFGQGLNSCPSGGILLKAKFQPEAIICEPNRHSKYLGEYQYTVDPLQATNMEVVEHYPESN